MNLRKYLTNSIWKLKATQRAKQLNSIEKRNKELIKSRDKAKEKSCRLRVKNEQLKERIVELEHELKKN
jgi:hypothetical protein